MYKKNVIKKIHDKVNVTTKIWTKKSTELNVLLITILVTSHIKGTFYDGQFYY
jgi:hypothetical protein